MPDYQINSTLWLDLGNVPHKMQVVSVNTENPTPRYGLRITLPVMDDDESYLELPENIIETLKCES